MSKSFYFVFSFISLQHAQNPVAAQINRYSMTLSHQAQTHNDLMNDLDACFHKSVIFLIHTDYILLEIAASRVFLGADAQLLRTSLTVVRMPLLAFNSNKSQD